MFEKCHVKTLGRALGVAALISCFGHAAPSGSPKSTNLAQKQPKEAPISFDELDVQEKKNEREEKELDQEVSEKKPKRSVPQEPQRPSVLPTVSELVEAKISALKSKLQEQDVALAKAKMALDKEQQIEKKTFDNNAYLSLSLTNTAPSEDYRLDGTEILVDGKRLARGGKRNKGLPRVREVFFGAVEPGCHEVVVKAIYTRLKNDLISRFNVDRVVKLTKAQTFIAKNGYRVEITGEGFEQQNTVLSLYRGPALRFNKTVRPNFLPGAPIVSMDDVLKQGRVHIDYVTEDASNHRLVEKSVSIDGLPILDREKHDLAKEKDIVFDAPLAEGKHTLNVTLLFGEQKWVSGGPMYNFRLKFDRDFYVISGQSTRINLTGMPKGGFRSAAEESRYARSSMKILSEENNEFFPESTCKLIKAAEEARKKQQEIPNAPAPEENIEKKEENNPPQHEPLAPPGEGLGNENAKPEQAPIAPPIEGIDKNQNDQPPQEENKDGAATPVISPETDGSNVKSDAGDSKDLGQDLAKVAEKSDENRAPSMSGANDPSENSTVVGE